MPYEEEQMPVFVINGFLEAGKTQFLRFTMDQEYFQTEGTTVLVMCEDGEEEYPEKLLLDTHTKLVKVSDVSEITKEKLKELEAAFNPERVIIEWNGVWPMNELRLPDDWFLNQQITIIDTSSLDMYMMNMKPLMGQMLKYSEMVICNRADDIPEETLGNYYMQLKAMCSEGEIIFEGADGEIRGDFNIELPYDINADFIQVKPEDFGYFYVDMMDRPERYAGKRVEYTGQILAPEELGKEAFVPGRMVMTCCEADMQFLGLICKYKGASAFDNKDWVKIRGVVKAEENEHYGKVGPIIYCDSVVRTSPIDEVVGF